MRSPTRPGDRPRPGAGSRSAIPARRRSRPPGPGRPRRPRARLRVRRGRPRCCRGSPPTAARSRGGRWPVWIRPWGPCNPSSGGAPSPRPAPKPAMARGRVPRRSGVRSEPPACRGRYPGSPSSAGAAGRGSESRQSRSQSCRSWLAMRWRSGLATPAEERSGNSRPAAGRRRRGPPRPSATLCGCRMASGYSVDPRLPRCPAAGRLFKATGSCRARRASTGRRPALRRSPPLPGEAPTAR